MVATWRVNVLLGLSAFLFTFFFSNVNNTWQMSLFRAGSGFLIFFFLGFILRFILHQIASKKSPNSQLSNKENTSQTQVQNNPFNKAQSGDEFFQAIPLNALHNEEDINLPEEFSKAASTWNAQNQEG